MPIDPKALMLLAAKSNGLTGDDVRPWHMKASYTAYGQTGKHYGTYEEFWGSPRRFKVVITDSKSSQTEYGTEDGVFVAGKLSELPDESAAVEELLSNPVVVESGDAAVVEQRMEKYGTTELRCLYNDTPADAITFEVTERLVPALSESHSPGNSHPFLNSGRVYCLGSQVPIVRVIRSGARTVIRNGLSVYQDRYVSGDLEERGFNNSLLLSVHIEMLENLAAAGAPDFSLPLDAVLSKPKIRIDGRLAREQALSMPAPIYPPIARAARVTGVVAIEAAVDKAGRVMNARVANGPAMLCQSALDAVKRWTFKPYSIHGEPVAFQATINIRYSLK